jgi:hypothetical protein
LGGDSLIINTTLSVRIQKRFGDVNDKEDLTRLPFPFLPRERGDYICFVCLDTLLAMLGPTRQAVGTVAGRTMKDRLVFL